MKDFLKLLEKFYDNATESMEAFIVHLIIAVLICWGACELIEEVFRGIAHVIHGVVKYQPPQHSQLTLD